MPLSPQITITPEDIVYKSFDITAVSYTSSTATYTATGHTLSAGNIVMITGLAPDGYNGTYTISSVATNTFTVANSTNTALTDQTGNVYWADPTEYEYTGGQTVAYLPDNGDVSGIVSSALAPIEVAVNGKNKIYRQSTAPSGSLTVGDVWFDTSNGNRQYYWNGTSWVDVQDTAIAAAASAATAAQNTADGKNKVYRQGTTPTGTFSIGDLWFNTSSDNAISRWDGSSWVLNSLGNNALASISANKLNAGSIDASVITVSNINAGNISTGYLAAARIQTGSLDASVITAGTITASQIATGTITATQIAAGTITVDKLSAGTLTGFTIQTNSVNNRIVMGSSNNALSFYYSGSAVAHMVATTGGAGVWLHYGTSASPGTRNYPLVNLDSSSASIEGSNIYQIVSSSTGNVIYGAASTTSSLTVGSSITAGSSTPGLFEFLSSSGRLRVSATYGGTSGGSVMYVTSAGLFGVASSTERKKKDIQSYQIDEDALLSLDTKTFRYKDEIDDDQFRQFGFIAEEADALGLFELVGYDEEGLPDRIAYDRIPTFLIPIIRKLKQRVQDQEARIKALEGN